MLGREPDRPPSPGSYWRVLCDCGREKVMRLDRMRKFGTCGHRRVERVRAATVARMSDPATKYIVPYAESTCRLCAARFLGLATARYCSVPCRRRATIRKRGAARLGFAASELAHILEFAAARGLTPADYLRRAMVAAGHPPEAPTVPDAKPKGPPRRTGAPRPGRLYAFRAACLAAADAKTLSERSGLAYTSVWSMLVKGGELRLTDCHRLADAAGITPAELHRLALDPDTGGAP